MGQAGRAVAAVALAFACVGAWADGPKSRFEDDLVARLEGDWTVTRRIRGTTVANRLTARWVLGHQFLEIHMKDVKEPPAYEAIVLVGFIHETGRYVAHWTDTWGGKFSARGLGTRAGNRIEFRFDYDDGPFYNTFSWDPERSRWTFRMESVAPDGTRRLFAEDTLAR